MYNTGLDDFHPPHLNREVRVIARSVPPARGSQGSTYRTAAQKLASCILASAALSTGGGPNMILMSRGMMSLPRDVVSDRGLPGLPSSDTVASLHRQNYAARSV
jgi:hypothetical protein